MADQISSLGIQTQSSRMIQTGAQTLSLLSMQLATGKRSQDLTDYSASETKKILSFRGTITRHESYVRSIDEVQPRLKLYSQTLDGLSKITSDALRMANDASTYAQAQSTSMGEQLEVMIKQVELYINQREGDRYLYSGSRASTAPAGNILSLALPPAETYPVTTPTLPPWDSQRIAGTSTNAAGWAQSAVTIDDGTSITYGIRNVDDGLQELVQGMRWLYAATQDSANYATYVANAKTELNAALPDIRDLEAGVAQNIKTVADARDLHLKLISDLKGNIDDVQNVDVNEVATKVTFYQTQLQASYSVTAKLASLTILNYLR